MGGCIRRRALSFFKSFAHKRAFVRSKLRRRYGQTRLGNAPELPFIAKAVVVAPGDEDEAA
jgi:hypothetical protein